jgi:hypothetical protein
MSNSRLARWCVCGMAIARPVASADVPAESSVGSICTVVVESDLLIVERNSDGAQRLTMNTQTYILQHDARYYLSKSQGSKTVVFDVTSYAIVREIDRSPLTSPTATATIRDYLELADRAYPAGQIASKYPEISEPNCRSEPVAPERFTLRSLPIDLPAQRL